MLNIEYGGISNNLCEKCISERCISTGCRAMKKKLIQQGYSYCKTCGSIKQLKEFRNVNNWYYICVECDNKDAKTKISCTVCNKLITKAKIQPTTFSKEWARAAIPTNCTNQ